MTKLMGYNEPYNKNWISPSDAVEYWRRYVQPTALELGLDLVGPTTSAKESGLTWNAEFIYLCYLLEDDEDFPCLVDEIKFWSIHYYDCNPRNWGKNYGAHNGRHSVNKRLGDALDVYMGDDIGKKDWHSWANNIRQLVTETSCEKSGRKGSLDRHGTPETSCKMITGQITEGELGLSDHGYDYGEGSIKWLM
jgi:hypothetical protein